MALGESLFHADAPISPPRFSVQPKGLSDCLLGLPRGPNKGPAESLRMYILRPTSLQWRVQGGETPLLIGSSFAFSDVALQQTFDSPFSRR